ncbi:MAG: hypothetical protein WCE35_07545 [Bradyrhizobium sp.]
MGGFVADPSLLRHILPGRLGRAIVVGGGLSLMNWFDPPDPDDL